MGRGFRERFSLVTVWSLLLAEACMVVLQRVIDTLSFLRFYACIQSPLLLSYNLLGVLHIINEDTFVKSQIVTDFVVAHSL